MHPRQASLLTQASEVADRTAGKSPETMKQALAGGQAILWKYTDPDGKVFYLEEKKITGIKSPFSGKTFSAKPERHTPQQVGKEMKEDAKGEAKTAADRWKA
jgi:hypothetical protein